MPGRGEWSTGSAGDMLADAVAFPVVGINHVGVNHLIICARQPTIEATLDVRQRFAEDAVRKPE